MTSLPTFVQRWRARGYFAATLLVVAAASYVFGLRATGKALSIENASLDFGEVWENAKFDWTLPIRNTTADPIEVLSFSTSCSCLDVRPQSFVVQPGQAQRLTLTLDLTRVFRPDGPDQLTSEISFVPTIMGHPLQNEGWRLKGKVRKLLRPFPMSIRLPDQLTKGVDCMAEAKATVFASVPLDDLLAESTSKDISVTVHKRSPEHFEIVTRASPRLPIGPFQHKIILKPVADKKELPEKAITITGEMHAEVEALPSRVLFGAHVGGERLRQTVRLVSRSGTPFKIRSWRVQGDVKDNDVRLETWLSDSFIICANAVGPAGVAQERLVIVDLVVAAATKREPIQIAIPISYLPFSKGS
jgi:hypothetical protein